jgi:acyl-CoA thioesterase-1
LEGVALKPEMNLSDGMHPNQAGIGYIAMKMLPQVKALLAKTGQ